jgi:hypothetical protein
MAYVIQLTQEQAITFAKNEYWKVWDPPTRAFFQVCQDRLCMPFDVFHSAVEETLGRPVPVRELGPLGRVSLRAELMELVGLSTLVQVMAHIAQLTSEQTIAFAESKIWEKWNLPTRALFQIHQNKLCMPFNVFQEAVEKTLDRPVSTHEFSSPYLPGLKNELMESVDSSALVQFATIMYALRRNGAK